MSVHSLALSTLQESVLAIDVALQDDDHQRAFSNFSDSTCQGNYQKANMGSIRLGPNRRSVVDTDLDSLRP